MIVKLLYGSIVILFHCSFLFFAKQKTLTMEQYNHETMKPSNSESFNPPDSVHPPADALLPAYADDIVCMVFLPYHTKISQSYSD